MGSRNGCHWDELTCATAAQYGHLEILKWARENGCPWHELLDLCNSDGNLEVLKWAR